MDLFRQRKWDVPPGMIGAGIAESDFGTAPAITHALHDAIDASFLTYLPEGLAREAELACSEFLGHRFSWSVERERVHLVPDVMAGFALVIEHFTPPEAKVIVPTPCYMPFLTESRKLGREVVQVPMLRSAEGRWELDLLGLEQAFRDGGGLLVLCNPHNPLGQVMTRAEQQGVAALVTKYDGRVFEDAIHAPVVYPGTTYLPYATLSADAARHTITATATSKGWNIPGLKAAQLILTSDEDQEAWHRRDPVPSLRGSILGAVAAIAAYRDGVDWLDGLMASLAENRDFVSRSIAEEIPGADFRLPEATYLAWIGLGGSGIQEPASYLRDHADLWLTAGAECGRGFESYIRFNFALQPTVLQDAVGRLSAAVRRRADARSSDMAGL
ncbi:MAG: aminotransferase class I/II-fold pyridoxal phosphate-dependent enzyme [Microbacterium sp.]